MIPHNEIVGSAIVREKYNMSVFLQEFIKIHLYAYCSKGDYSNGALCTSPMCH